MTDLAYSGVVLAGGASRRMGCDKRFLKIKGTTLLAWVLERVRSVVSELIVVAQDVDALVGLDARLTQDRFPGLGVLAGLHAGLDATVNPWAFVVAGDMPLLNPDLLRAMARLADASTCDLVVPRRQGFLEPLHGLYRVEACALAAERALRAGRRRVIAFYPDVRVRVMEAETVRRWDPSGESFVNVNTVEDYQAVLRRLDECSTEYHTSA